MIPCTNPEILTYRCRKHRFRTVAKYRLRDEWIVNRFRINRLNKYSFLPKNLNNVIKQFNLLRKVGTPVLELNNFIRHSFNILEDFSVKEIKQYLEYMTLISVKEFNPILNVLYDCINSRKNGFLSFVSTINLFKQKYRGKKTDPILSVPEQGLIDIIFFKMNTNLDFFIAIGYNRLIMGIDNPYVEFRKEQINWKICKKIENHETNSYYEEWIVFVEKFKIYDQKKKINKIPNSYLKKKKKKFRNFKDEYFDYRVGCCYISVQNTTIITRTYIFLLYQKINFCQNNGIKIQKNNSKYFILPKKKKILKRTHISGFYFISNFITFKEQAQVRKQLNQLEKYFLNDMYKYKRKNIQFGWSFNYNNMELFKIKNEALHSLNEWKWILDKIKSKIKRIFKKRKLSLNQLLLSKNLCKDISDQNNFRYVFGNVMIGISLLSPCLLEFKNRKLKETKTVYLPDRSMFIISEKYSYEYTDTIEFKNLQFYYEQVAQGYLLSIIWRYIIENINQILNQVHFNFKREN